MIYDPQERATGRDVFLEDWSLITLFCNSLLNPWKIFTYVVQPFIV